MHRIFCFLYKSLILLQESQELSQHEHNNRNLLILADNYTNNYKYTLRNVWESFKDFIAKIKNQLKTLSKAIKQKLQILTEEFERRLDTMKSEFQKIMKEALVVGEDIKECLQVKIM